MARKELRAILDAGYRIMGATPIIDLQDGPTSHGERLLGNSGSVKHDCVFNILRNDGKWLKIYDWKDVKSLSTLPPLEGHADGLIDI